MADQPTADKTDEDTRARGAPSAWRRHALLSPDGLRKAVRHVGYRAFRITGEAVSVGLALGAAMLFFAAGLVSRQSADLTSLRPNFQTWFSQGFEGARAELGDLELRWNPTEDTVSFTATDIRVFDQDESLIQTLPVLRATTTKADILARRASLTDLDIVGGVVTWRQSADGEIVAGLGSPETVGRFGPVYRGQSNGNAPARFGWLDQFNSVRLRDSKAHVVREADGLDLVMFVDDMDGRRDGTALTLQVDARLARRTSEPSESDVDAGGIALTFETTDDFETSRLKLVTDALRPSALGPNEGRLSVLSALDLPIDVVLEGERSGDGQILSARVDLEAGEGRVSLGGQTHAVTAARFVGALDPGEEVMTVETLNVDATRLRFESSGVLEQIGRLYDGDIGTSPKFDLSLSDGYVDFTPTFERAITMDRARAVGELDLDARELSLDRLDARFKGVALDLSGRVVTSETGFSTVQLAGRTVAPMSAQDMLSLWPVNAADGARRWIDRAVLDGVIETVSFDIDLDPDFFANPMLTSDRLQLDFTARDGVVQYISTMDPLTEAVGSGRIDGNRLGFVLESGRINRVEVVGGDIDIPRLMPKGGDILVSVEGRGGASELLAIVNQPPFGYLDRYGVTPDGFSGQADVTLNIRRPLLEFFDQDRIEYSVEGQFTDASAPFEFGGFGLTDADVTIRGGKDGLFVEGPASLGPWRANVSWVERYGLNGEPTRYAVNGTLDRKTLDALGIGFRQQFGGELGIDVEASGQGLMVTDAIMDIDLSAAELSVGDIWSKTVDEPGRVRAVLSREDGTVSFPKVELRAPGLEMDGAITFREGFALEEARFDTARIDGLIDGRLILSRDDAAGRLALDANGRSLDISPFVRRAVDRASGGPGLFALALDAAFNEITLAPGYALDNASLTYRHDGEAVERMSLRGDRADGLLLMTLDEVDGQTRSARLSVPDISEATAAILSLDATSGGSLNIKATLPASGQPGPVIGSAVATDFSVREAPFLAQILSLASLTGIVDTLSGEGLGFDALDFDFALQDGTFSVREAKLRGPAIGMTGAGEIGLADRTVDFSGALVPAYTANSLLGDIPLIGDIFVGKDGEGVFAVNYAVEGPFSQALVSINPLSALTPGFIRGIFRESREELPDSVVADIESVRPPSESEDG